MSDNLELLIESVRSRVVPFAILNIVLIDLDYPMRSFKINKVR